MNAVGHLNVDNNNALNHDAIAIDYQRNTSRWKEYSKYAQAHKVLKIITVVTAVFASIALFAGSIAATIFTAGTFWPILTVPSIFLGVVAMPIAPFLSKIFSFDLTEYSKPKVAAQVSREIALGTLANFKIKYGNKLNNLVRYGFISKNAANQINVLLKEKTELEKFINENRQFVQSAGTARHLPGVQALINEYTQKQTRLQELEQDFTQIRDNEISPFLPFPSA